MHISDGLLPPEVWIGGGVIAAGLTALSLRRLPDRQVPTLAMMTSVFFAASLLHLKFAGTSVHLILPGLVGAVVGRRALIPIVIGITLQALLFGHGGISTIGVNTLVMGLPAVFVGEALRWVPLERHRRVAYLAGFVAGVTALLLALALFLLVGLLAGEIFFVAIKVFVIAHLVLSVLEGAVTAAAVGYLSHVKPELLAHCHSTDIDLGVRPAG